MTQIAFQFDLPAGEDKKLAEVIGCSEAELPQLLAKYAKAATDEYAQMFLGKNAFRRTNDFLDFRIYLLIVHVLDGKLPDEAFISRLFQMAATESRARIRSVTSKYQRGLERQIKDSINAILDAGVEQEDGCYHVSINNHAVVDLLNSQLASIDGSLPQISKVKGTVASFSLAQSSFNKLREKYA